jgi:hypothetical protein
MLLSVCATANGIIQNGKWHYTQRKTALRKALYKIANGIIHGMGWLVGIIGAWGAVCMQEDRVRCPWEEFGGFSVGGCFRHKQKQK